MKFLQHRLREICIQGCVALFAGGLVLGTGCDEPEPGESRLVLQEREDIPGMPHRSEQPVEEPEAVLEMLKESDVETDLGVITIAQWVEQQLIEDGGQVMFPEWEVKRRGVRKYEVDFTYTVLKENHAIEKKGYRWNVDYVLQLVSAPGHISEEELDKESGHKSIMNYRESQAERVINLE